MITKIKSMFTDAKEKEILVPVITYLGICVLVNTALCIILPSIIMELLGVYTLTLITTHTVKWVMLKL